MGPHSMKKLRRKMLSFVDSDFSAVGDSHYLMRKAIVEQKINFFLFFFLTVTFKKNKKKYL
jgi:hypothetical protein